MKEKKRKINIRLLRKIQKFLLAEPRRFEMTSWISPADRTAELIEIPPCGTALCIAGAAYVIEKKLKLDYTRKGATEVRDFAVKAIGLDPRDFGNGLFYTVDWKQKFQSAYYMAKTPLDRAKVGVAVIEDFIKSSRKSSRAAK